MNKRKNDGDLSRSSGVSLPHDMWKKINEYLYAKCPGKDRSELFKELVSSLLEEWEKEKEVEESIEPTNKETYNSPLGSAMTTLEVHTINNNNIGEKRDKKPESELLEKMFLTPFDEIVKDNLEDQKYMREIMILLRKRYEFVSSVVAGFDNAPKVVKKNRDLQEAINKDRELHQVKDKQ